MSIPSVSEKAGASADLRTRKLKTNGAPRNGYRLPPHSTEDEQGVIGCILLSPNECLDKIQSRIGDNEIFYDLRHRTIFERMAEMHSRQEPIDLITLHRNLKDNEQLDQIGGHQYLETLLNSVPSASNLSYYLDAIETKLVLRKIIRVCTEAVSRVYEHDGDPAELIDEIERDILSIRIKAESRKTIKQHVQDAISHLEHKLENKGAISGLPTGLPDLDYFTDGLCKSELIVPAAFPGEGKTSLSMNFAEHVVLTCGKPVAVFSQEMTAKQLVLRMMYSNARVNGRRIGRGDMHEEDFPKLTRTAGKLSKAKLHIIDDAESVQQVIAESRRLKQEHDIQLIVVDYLQLVTGGAKGKDANREQEISGVAAALKRLAKELDLPIVAPSQLTDDGKLRESRAIGQHADLILKLASQAGENDNRECGEPVDIFIEKNRNGPSKVTVHLTFLKEFTRFESASKVSDEDVTKTQQ